MTLMMNQLVPCLSAEPHQGEALMSRAKSPGSRSLRCRHRTAVKLLVCNLLIGARSNLVTPRGRLRSTERSTIGRRVCNAIASSDSSIEIASVCLTAGLGSPLGQSVGEIMKPRQDVKRWAPMSDVKTRETCSTQARSHIWLRWHGSLACEALLRLTVAARPSWHFSQV